jgi:hypothetical protein
MYPLGTLKVVWVEDNVEYLSSDMFKPNQTDEAVAYGKTKGAFMIMELISQQKDLYRWKVLPYGKHKEYLAGVGLSKKIGNIFGNESNYTEVKKDNTQAIRLVDVFVIGPLLIYASTFKTLPSYLRIALLLIGVATIIYNGNNYIKKNK